MLGLKLLFLKYFGGAAGLDLVRGEIVGSGRVGDYLDGHFQEDNCFILIIFLVDCWI